MVIKISLLIWTKSFKDEKMVENKEFETKISKDKIGNGNVLTGGYSKKGIDIKISVKQNENPPYNFMYSVRRVDE